MKSIVTQEKIDSMIEQAEAIPIMENTTPADMTEQSKSIVHLETGDASKIHFEQEQKLKKRLDTIDESIQEAEEERKNLSTTLPSSLSEQMKHLTHYNGGLLILMACVGSLMLFLFASECYSAFMSAYYSGLAQFSSEYGYLAAATYMAPILIISLGVKAIDWFLAHPRSKKYYRIFILLVFIASSLIWTYLFASTFGGGYEQDLESMLNTDANSGHGLWLIYSQIVMCSTGGAICGAILQHLYHKIPKKLRDNPAFNALSEEIEKRIKIRKGLVPQIIEEHNTAVQLHALEQLIVNHGLARLQAYTAKRQSIIQTTQAQLEQINQLRKLN